MASRADLGAPFRRETEVAIAAAARGLAIARAGVGADAIASKGGRDLVTAADVAVEDAVREMLTAALGIPVVGEERGGPAAGGAAHWLVDPICGTRNFASGVPLYCVNLALVEAGEVAVAVVGDASTGGIDVAERGRGAWRVQDGAHRRLATSEATHTVIVEDGNSTGARRERAARFAAAAIRADRWDLRSLGTTLSSPYVAAGRAAAYVVFFVPALHAAAGSLLIAEAGGCVSDVDGRPWTVAADSLVGTANRRLRDELLDLAGASRD